MTALILKAAVYAAVVALAATIAHHMLGLLGPFSLVSKITSICVFSFLSYAIGQWDSR